jgi:hypothetical protein
MASPVSETTDASVNNNNSAPSSIASDQNAEIDEKERKRLQAQFGNPKEQAGKYILGKRGVKETFGEGSHDPQATVYFKNCHDCEFVVDAMCTKVLIEDCHGCTITLNKKVITNTLDIWKCNDSHIMIKTKIGTVQADICKNLKVHFQTKEDFTSLVWAGVHDLDLRFLDSGEQLTTGFRQMAEKYPGLNEQIDQFIIRFVKDELTSEQIVRLSNGYPTTEREAKAWDDKHEEIIQKLAKEAGITIGKKKAEKIAPNAVCPKCTSGKKYKKCCGKP